jgi:hypothetical protein
MWQTILNIGSLAGLLSIAGAAYLYFEARKFKKLEATKEYRLARAELAELEGQRAGRVRVFEQAKHQMARASNNETWEINRSGWEKLDKEQQTAEFEFSAEETKAQARVKYYRALKNHKFLWFLRRDDADDEPWTLVE